MFLLAAALFAGDWVPDTTVPCVSGTVSTSQGLYDAIDGGAEEYIRRGFKAGLFSGYVKDGVPACVEVYDQGCADSAKSVFMAVASGEYKPFSAKIDTARLDTSSTVAFVLEALKGKYFIRVSVQTRDEKVLGPARDLLHAVVRRLKIPS